MNSMLLHGREQSSKSRSKAGPCLSMWESCCSALSMLRSAKRCILSGDSRKVCILVQSWQSHPRSSCMLQLVEGPGKVASFVTHAAASACTSGSTASHMINWLLRGAAWAEDAHRRPCILSLLAWPRGCKQRIASDRVAKSESCTLQTLPNISSCLACNQDTCCWTCLTSSQSRTSR